MFRFAKHILSFTEDAVDGFMKDVLSGKVRTSVPCCACRCGTSVFTDPCCDVPYCFLYRGVQVKTIKFAGEFPAIETSEAWDGKDGVLPREDL